MAAQAKESGPARRQRLAWPIYRPGVVLSLDDVVEVGSVCVGQPPSIVAERRKGEGPAKVEAGATTTDCPSKGNGVKSASRIMVAEGESISDSGEEYRLDEEYGDLEDMKPYAEEDTLSPLSPPALRKELSYTRLDEHGLAQAQVKTIERVATELSLDISTAGIMLVHEGWDESAVIRRYRLEGLSFAQVCGVTARDNSESEDSASEGEEGMVECLLCLEDRPQDDMYGLGCCHLFCKSCWREYCTTVVMHGTSTGASCLVAQCPHQRCSLLVGEKTFRTFLADEALEIYLRKLKLSFVNDNDALAWCPKAGCGNAIAFSVRKRTVTCSCKHRFCFRCKDEAHAPANCKEAKMWKRLQAEARKENEDNKTGDLAESKDKPCPNCGTPTYRIDGCLYITCQTCHCAWCWECGHYGGGKTGRKVPHHVFKCNDPKNDEWLIAGFAAFGEKYRYTFVLKNFLRYQRKSKEQESILEALDRHIEDIALNASSSKKLNDKHYGTPSFDKQGKPNLDALRGIWFVTFRPEVGAELLAEALADSRKAFDTKQAAATLKLLQSRAKMGMYIYIHKNGEFTTVHVDEKQVNLIDKGSLPFKGDPKIHKIMPFQERPSTLYSRKQRCRRVGFRIKCNNFDPFLTLHDKATTPHVRSTVSTMEASFPLGEARDPRNIDFTQMGCKLIFRPLQWNGKRCSGWHYGPVTWTRVTEVDPFLSSEIKKEQNARKRALLREAISIVSSANRVLAFTHVKGYFTKSVVDKALLKHRLRQLRNYAESLEDFLSENATPSSENQESVQWQNQTPNKAFEMLVEKTVLSNDHVVMSLLHHGLALEPARKCSARHEKRPRAQNETNIVGEDGKHGKCTDLEVEDVELCEAIEIAGEWMIDKQEDQERPEEGEMSKEVYFKAAMQAFEAKEEASRKAGRERWEKFVSLLSAADHCCEQLEYHIESAEAEQAMKEAGNTLRSMHKESSALGKHLLRIELPGGSS